MEVRLYLQMLLRSWWLIVLVALVAVTASLGASFMAVPQYEATARFILNPSAAITTSADIVRSLDTLDRPSVAATYVEVMNSQKIFTDAVVGLKLNPADPGLAKYTVLAVALPSSSVLQLSVLGPNPTAAAEFANAIGNQSISYARRVNSVYNMEFLDIAVPPIEPISPQPLRDAGLALVLGAVAGAILAILSEQIRMPIEALRRRNLVDQTSSAFNRRHFENKLEEEQARSQAGNTALGLIRLEGLFGLTESLPSILVQHVFHEVTRRLRNELRGNDIVGRWGEIEFAVMLPSTPSAAAERTFERIRLSLSQPIFISQTKESIQLQPIIGIIACESREPIANVIDRAEKKLVESHHNQMATFSGVVSG
ncbi:MAG: diguanylate cyclase [Chloroflexi bacterium]|nr:diguanylate cyclase [Chloroflexota bacterium]